MKHSEVALEARVAQLVGELQEARDERAAFAASKARLESELEARTRELTATGDVLKVISRSAFDLQAVLDTLTELAARLCGADTAIIRRREGDAYPVAATYGLTEKQRDHFAIYPTSPSRESVFGRAVTECRTIHVPDVLADPEYNRPQLQDFVAVRAMLGVPLIRNGVPVGVFTLQRRAPQPYSQQQIDLVTTFADQALIAIENVRLFQEVQARTAEAQESLEYQTATADVLNVISRAPSQLQPVFEAIVETAARLCEADSATVFQLADDGRYHLTSSHGYSPEYRELLMRRPLSSSRETAIGRMAVECRTVQIEDTLSDPEYTFHEAQKLGGYRSILAVPLLWEGKAIAAIALGRSAVRPFSAKQIRLIETFADQAVIAIQNVRLFEEVQARTHELEQLLQQQAATADVLRAISRSAFDLQPVLETLVEAATRLCDADHAWLFRRDGEFFHWVAGYGHVAEVHQRLTEYFQPLDVPVDRSSVTGRAALERRVVQVPDVLADSEYAWGGAQAIGHYRAAMGVPLWRNDEVVGVIFVGRTRAEPFSEKQIELATTFADQAVIAIENARLFEEVQARTRELQESLDYQTATSEVLNVISHSTFHLQPVLDTLVNSAGRLCQAENVQIFLRNGDVYCLEAHNGFSPEYQEYARQHPIAPGRGTLVARTALEAAPIHMPDVLADPEYTWHEGRTLAAFRAMLGVPLLREGSCVGVMAMTRAAPRPFTDKQIELVTTFADQAVIAIENARLFQEVQARTQELTESLEYQTATSEVLNVISRSPSELGAVLDAIVTTASRLCQAEYAFVWRLENGQFSLAETKNMDQAFAKFLSTHPPRIDRKTVTGRAVVERRTVHIPDVLADVDYAYLEGQKIADYRSVLGVPLLRDGAPIGVIVLFRNFVHPFSPKQIDLVSTFADQAVIAIENVRLFDEVQARTRELQESLEYQTATSDVLNVISRAPSQLDPVFDAIVQTAARLCQAEYSLVYTLRRGEYRVAATNNAEEEFVQYARANPLRPGRGSLIGRTALEGRTVHMADCLADPEYTVLEYQKVGKYRSTLGVPLIRDGVTIGVIALMRSVVEPFAEKQIELVETFADQAVIAIENVRLFEALQARTCELQESLEYQTATSEVLEVMSQSPTDAEPVFKAIVQSAARLCGAVLSNVQLYDGELLHIGATHNFAPDALESFLRMYPRKPDRSQLAGRAILSRNIVHVHDVLVDPEYAHEVAVASNLRAMLSVPMFRDGKPVGVITVVRREAAPFSERQIELLKTFADQAVIAIGNVRLFEEVQARTRELQESLEYQTATSDVLNVISRSPSDIQPVLDAIVDTAARLCRADFALVWKLHERRYHVASVASDTTPELADYALANPIDPGRETLVGRAAIERATVHIPDVTLDPKYCWSDGRWAGLLRTMLGVPLLRDRAVIGVIALHRRMPQPFSQREIDLVTTFADQAVIAINNVGLFEEVQARTRELARSVQELRALGEVSHAVNSTLDLETVLSTIVAKAVQLSSTEAGAIYVFSKLRQKFRLRATYGMTAAMIAEIGKQSVGLGESYIGSATSSGEAVQVADLAAEPPSPIRDLVLIAGYRALLVVPLMRPGRVVGALVVRRKEPGLFPSSTIDLLQTFAAQSVLAIQNARLFEDVDARTRELAKSLKELRAAQERLIQTEKLASLGQLTAGIAHEIKNPLNFVNNFAALSIELIDELKDALRSAPQDGEQMAEVMELLAGNLGKVVQHGKRADSIVKNMLLHSRAGSGERRVADINGLVEESLNLAYHGARAEKQGFNVTIKRSLDPSAGEVDVLPQEITRVLLNLISNGFYATVKRKERAAPAYEPTILAATRNLGDQVEIRIRDNGTGIPPEVREKMFDPFFTTKPAGEGTGLGLSLSHDIVVKQHRGSIEVDTSPGEYTEFRIVLPRSATSPPNDEVRQ